MERFLLPFLCAQGALETRLLVNSSSCESTWARWVLEFPTRLQAPSLIICEIHNAECQVLSGIQGR